MYVNNSIHSLQISANDSAVLFPAEAGQRAAKSHPAHCMSTNQSDGIGPVHLGTDPAFQ